MGACYASEDKTRVFEAFLDGLTDRKGYAVEARLFSRIDEKYEWFLFTATPRFLNNGEFAGFTGTAINIDELKTLQTELANLVQQRTHELEISNTQLRRSNAELEQFAYVACDERNEYAACRKGSIAKYKKYLQRPVVSPERTDYQFAGRVEIRFGIISESLNSIP